MPEERQDRPSTMPSYWALPVADVERARAFFGAVMSWEFEEPGVVPGGVNVKGLDVPGGLVPGGPLPVITMAFSVPDLFRTLDDIDAHGGSAQEPETANTDYGTWVECTDDQGTVFALFQPGGVVTNRAARNLG